MELRKILFLLPILMMVLVIGCSDDDSPTGNGGDYTPADSFWTDGNTNYARLDATNYDNYKHFNLVNSETVAADGEWHVAFKRELGKLNGGSSGNLGVVGVDLAGIGHADSTAFDNVTAVTIADDLYQADTYKYRFEGWQYYTGDPLHEIRATHKPFLLMTADGNHAKVVIDSIYGYAQPPNMGTIGLSYVYNPDGEDLTGATMTVEIDGSSGSVYFSFATGGAVDITDPATSTDWDLHFNNFDVKVNGGAGGPGGAGVYLGDDLPDNFDDILNGETNGYFADAMLSVFGPEDVEMNRIQWYNYTGSPAHELLTKNHVYIIKLPNGNLFKLAIENYYAVIDEMATPAWYTIKYAEL